jgi:transcriptional regulator with XRE-family HTH domain
MTDLNSELTELLRDMRHQAGLSGSQLGKMLGWSVSSNPSGKSDYCSNVAHYEAGDRVPKLEMVGRWAAACGFHAELVVTRHDAGRWIVPLNDGPQP